MSRGRWPFRKTDIRRAVEAARAAGLPIHGIEIDRAKNGIRVLTGGLRPDDPAMSEAGRGNPPSRAGSLERTTAAQAVMSNSALTAPNKKRST